MKFAVCSVQHDGVYLMQAIRVAMGEEQLDRPRLLPLQEVPGYQAVSYSEEAEKVRGGSGNLKMTELPGGNWGRGGTGGRREGGNSKCLADPM